VPCSRVCTRSPIIPGGLHARSQTPSPWRQTPSPTQDSARYNAAWKGPREAGRPLSRAEARPLEKERCNATLLPADWEEQQVASTKGVSGHAKSTTPTPTADSNDLSHRVHSWIRRSITAGQQAVEGLKAHHQHAMLKGCPSINACGESAGTGPVATVTCGTPSAGNAEGLKEQSLLSLDDDGRHMPLLRICFGLAKRHGCCISDVLKYWHEFRGCDPQPSGDISWRRFIELLRGRAGLDPQEEIPRHLLGRLAHLEKLGRVNFEDFLCWSVSVAWLEELQVPQTEREIRRIAREKNMTLLEVDRFKRTFDKFDSDGSGEIEEKEFRSMMYSIFKVKDVYFGTAEAILEGS